MLLQKAKNVSSQSGCYCFKNINNIIIYVGKAKNLKKRLMSYFIGSHNTKTQKMLLEAKDFFCLLTDNEQEALILESNLIKKYFPKYNFKLIDDKTYPYIEITKTKHPVIKISRYKKISKQKMLFGPYPNVKIAREILKILQKLYPLCRCKVSASSKPCFYYHIGQCLGACAGKKIDYSVNINLIKNFLKGDNKKILKHLRYKMLLFSKQLLYEKALEYHQMIINIKHITQNKILNISNITDSDILAFVYNDDNIAIQILKIRLGRIVDIYRSVFSYIGIAEDNVITYINLYYQKEINPSVLIIGNELSKYQNDLSDILKLKVYTALRGYKKKLYQLALKNAYETLNKDNLIYQLKYEKIEKALDKISIIFNKKISYIEVFDNSQLFGSHYVSAKIVFKNLELQKKFYRKYILKNSYLNDFEAFKEVLTRNYKNQSKTNELFLPDLILIDGGQAQFNIVYNFLKFLGLDISLGALQKDSHHNLNALITKDKVIYLSDNDVLFSFLYQLSDEVHRYVLNFHRQRKRKKDIESLLNLKGLDNITKKILLEKIINIEDIKYMNEDDFDKIGIKKNIYIKIKNHLNN